MQTQSHHWLTGSQWRSQKSIRWITQIKINRWEQLNIKRKKYIYIKKGDKLKFGMCVIFSNARSNGMSYHWWRASPTLFYRCDNFHLKLQQLTNQAYCLCIFISMLIILWIRRHSTEHGLINILLRHSPSLPLPVSHSIQRFIYVCVRVASWI